MPSLHSDVDSPVSYQKSEAVPSPFSPPQMPHNNPQTRALDVRQKMVKQYIAQKGLSVYFFAQPTRIMSLRYYSCVRSFVEGYISPLVLRNQGHKILFPPR